MTDVKLIDWYAAHAMQAMLMKHEKTLAHVAQSAGGDVQAVVAHGAFKMAEAMLRHRERTGLGVIHDD